MGARMLTLCRDGIVARTVARSINYACLALVVANLSGGCTAMNEAIRPTQRSLLAPGFYQLRLQPAIYDIPDTFAPVELDRTALNTCPMGYVRDRQWWTHDDGPQTLVWEIHCIS